MSDFASSPTADLLRDATRLFSGLRDNPEIAADLAPFDYTADDAEVGLTAIDALREAMRVQASEDAEATVAARASTAATAAVRAAYVVHRGRARRAHPAGTPGYVALDLAGDTPRTEGALFTGARRFYETLTDQPALAAPVRNLPRRTIADALVTLATAETADDAQTREGGEAQRATALR